MVKVTLQNASLVEEVAAAASSLTSQPCIAGPRLGSHGRTVARSQYSSWRSGRVTMRLATVPWPVSVTALRSNLSLLKKLDASFRCCPTRLHSLHLWRWLCQALCMTEVLKGGRKKGGDSEYRLIFGPRLMVATSNISASLATSRKSGPGVRPTTAPDHAAREGLVNYLLRHCGGRKSVGRCKWHVTGARVEDHTTGFIGLVQHDQFSHDAA